MLSTIVCNIVFAYFRNHFTTFAGESSITIGVHGPRSHRPKVRRPTKFQPQTLLLAFTTIPSLFSVFTSPWSKLKIVTIQRIKSRLWYTIDDWYIKNLAKNQVSAVFHSRVICRSVSPKFIELCMETPCLCPSEGHKYGGRNVTNICPWVLLLKRKIIALKLRGIERNVSSSARTVKLSETKW